MFYSLCHSTVYKILIFPVIYACAPYSSTWPVKTWLKERGVFVPCSVKCRLCNTPETIEHWIIFCRNVFLFWDVLQRTLKKDVSTPHTIFLLPVTPGSLVPYDLFHLIGLRSLWRCRMIDRNDDSPRTTKLIFIELVGQVKTVCEHVGEWPDWYPLFGHCLCLLDLKNKVLCNP